MLILLVVTWLFYFLIKGVSVKETKVLLIITSTVWVINILVLNGIDGGFIKFFMTIYFIYSFLDYLSINFTGKKILEIPWMSGIKVENDQIYLNYQILRPITFFFVNIFLLIKKQPMLGFKDTIEVEVNSSDKTKIKIKL
ncbi:MAG: hypothetical protein JXR69_09840 [Candidatus Delongbacteria bacterium]|nr:hypothetical protein [Candidatus Delongbacteria bacterium]